MILMRREAWWGTLRGGERGGKRRWALQKRFNWGGRNDMSEKMVGERGRREENVREGFSGRDRCDVQRGG